VTRFLVEGSHFKLLDSVKGAPDADLIGEVADETLLPITFTMPAKGTKAQFTAAFKRARGQGLTIADVKEVKAVTALVQKVLEKTSTVPVTEEQARELLEKCQWNCNKLRTPLKAAKESQLKKIFKKVQALRAAFKRAEGHKFTNEELVPLQDGSPTHRAKLSRAMRRDGVQRVPRAMSDKIHGEQKAVVSYKTVREKWGVSLHRYKDKKTGKEFIDSDGSALSLPIYYLGAVKGLHGLRARVHAHTNYKILDETKVEPKSTSAFPAQSTAYDVSKLQGFPVDAWFADDNSAICYNTLGGDNGKADETDLAVVMKKIGKPMPKYFTLSPDGSAADGDATADATMENRLDRQVQACHGYKYLGSIPAQNTADSFAGSFQIFITTDTFNVDGVTITLDVMSCSWGMPAANVSQQDRQRFGTMGVNAMLKHKIITVATGDNGSKDGTDSDTPDSPSETIGFIGAAGCYIDTSDGHTINVIEVWFDGTSGSGGGISDFFAQVDAEKQYNLPVSNTTKKAGHSASLLAGNGDPRSGPYVFWNGKWYRVGGTSACAPELAAKLKKMNLELKHPIPDMIAFCYAHFVEGICRQVTAPGTNGGYAVNPSDQNGMNVPLGGGMPAYAPWQKVARRVQDGIGA